MNRNTTFFGIGFLIMALFLLHLCCVKGPSEIERTTYKEPIKAVLLNASNFDSLALDHGITSVVEFYSTDSPICTALTWVIDSMAARSADTVLFGAVNSDADDALLTRYDINTLPTYLFFHRGIQVTRRSYSAITPGAYDSLILILDDILAGRNVPVVLTPVNFTTLVDVPDRIAVVEFFSPFCGHCQAMEAPVADMAFRFKDRALIGKINVDEQDSLRGAYGVMAWPTFIFFVGGVEQSRKIGAMPEDSLATAIETILHREPDKVVRLNASNFDSLALDSDITSVVEFHSAGSPICKAMAWVIDCMAARSADTVLFGAVNIDADDEFLQQYGINTLPTYLFFHRGIQVAKRSYSTIAPGAYDSLLLILDEILAGRSVPILLTPENFTTLVAAANCVSVVEFFSPNCGYCQAMEAPLASLALRFSNRALIGKVNVDEQDSLRGAYGVMSWPTFIFFAGGVEQSREIGPMPEDSLAARLDGLLLGTFY